MTLPEGLTAGAATDLAAGFPPVDDAAWAEAARGALGGRDPETLVRTTLDGIEVAPLYAPSSAPAASDVAPAASDVAPAASDVAPAASDVAHAAGELAGLPGASPHVRGRTATRRGWTIHVTADHPDVDVAAVRLAADVDGGAEGVMVAAGVATADLATLLGPHAGRLDAVTLRPRHDALAAATVLLDTFGTPAATHLGLGVDPVGLLATDGWLATDPDAVVVQAAALLADGGLPDGARPFTLDASPWSSAGGSDAEVLGLLVAQVLHVLRGLAAAGVDADTAVDRIQVLLPLDADQFAGLCALRALRRLVDRVATLAGASPDRRAVRTDVVMAPRVLTRRDPWVNLLRGTVVAFVAGVGGADGALLAPYDALGGDPSPLGRRLARTTQLVLREESRLARADDPAGGSWYVEQRTDELARAAWEVVRDVDRQGGIVSALRSGWIASLLADTRARRDRDLATRRWPITGVSEFPDLYETPLPTKAGNEVPLPTKAGYEAAQGTTTTPPADAVRVEPLPVRRFADAYEALRDRSDALLAATGARPTVFLATLGPLAEHTARAGFARNLYAAGGIDAVVHGGSLDPVELAAAFAASGTTIACVCGTDERYAELGAEVVRALREGGAAAVHLAGRTPSETPDDARPDEEVRLGSDVVAVLTRTYDTLDAAPAPGTEA